MNVCYVCRGGQFVYVPTPIARSVAVVPDVCRKATETRRWRYGVPSLIRSN
jgi:hypothetical protein